MSASALTRMASACADLRSLDIGHSLANDVVLETLGLHATRLVVLKVMGCKHVSAHGVQCAIDYACLHTCLHTWLHTSPYARLQPRLSTSVQLHSDPIRPVLVMVMAFILMADILMAYIVMAFLPILARRGNGHGRCGRLVQGPWYALWQTLQQGTVIDRFNRL